MRRRSAWGSAPTGNDTSNPSQYQQYHCLFNRLAPVAGVCAANDTTPSSRISIPPYAGVIVQEDGKCTPSTTGISSPLLTGESYARPRPPSISASANQH